MEQQEFDSSVIFIVESLCGGMAVAFISLLLSNGACLEFGKEPFPRHQNLAVWVGVAHIHVQEIPILIQQINIDLFLDDRSEGL